MAQVIAVSIFPLFRSPSVKNPVVWNIPAIGHAIVLPIRIPMVKERISLHADA